MVSSRSATPARRRSPPALAPRQAPEARRGGYEDAVFFGTFLPFFRASDSPIAMACFRLFTVLPLRPLLSLPLLRRRMARSTSFAADRDSLAIFCSFKGWSTRYLKCPGANKVPRAMRPRLYEFRFFQGENRTTAGRPNLSITAPRYEPHPRGSPITRIESSRWRRSRRTTE